MFRLKRLMIFACLCFLIQIAHAYEVKVVDQKGAPIKDAVVSLPENFINAQHQSEELPIAVMDQKNKQFVPKVLLIEKGQSVSFPNSDNIRHHVYSFSDAKRFEIKLYADTPEAPVLFDQAGVVILGCNIHDRMLGYIYVSEAGISAQTNAEGLSQFTQDLSDISQLNVWHPDLADPTRPMIVNSLMKTNNSITVSISLAPTVPVKSSNSRWR